MRSVVVLPAPLGPRKPNSSPCGTSRLIAFTAVKLAVPLREVRELDHFRVRRAPRRVAHGQHVDLEIPHQPKQLRLTCEATDRRTADAPRRRETDRRLDRPRPNRRAGLPARRGSRICRRRRPSPAAMRAGSPAARARATNNWVCSLQSPVRLCSTWRAFGTPNVMRFFDRIVDPRVDPLGDDAWISLRPRELPRQLKRSAGRRSGGAVRGACSRGRGRTSEDVSAVVERPVRLGSHGQRVTGSAVGARHSDRTRRGPRPSNARERRRRADVHALVRRNRRRLEYVAIVRDRVAGASLRQFSNATS